SRPSAPARPAREAPNRPAPRPTPPPPVRPELVLLLPLAVPTDVLAAAGYPVLQDSALSQGHLYRLALPPGADAAQALADLGARFPGAPAGLNTLYTPEDFLCPDGSCAAQEMIGWSGWPSAMAPRIGMIDTGINPAHEALAGQRLHLHPFETGTETGTGAGAREAAGRQHGTAVAALLIGRLDSRTPGLLPLAELHAVEAFHRSAGQESADAFAIARGIDLLLDRQVSVINMSFSGPENPVLQALVQRAAAAGVGLVAAAGNGGPGAAPAYPAAWPEVIAVTAIDARDRAWRQANRGPYVTFAAPGVNLWTAASISGGRLRSGTSYAAPFVTAVLAVEIARRPELTREEHTERLIACARDLGEAGFDETFGHGVISVSNQCLASDAAENPAYFHLSGE
ncbi:S8 family serine peptidase, partial [Pseudogemmobacter sonorensis]|uniref:S8 family serine peptidase n=1 Tax=Pseudogemmobacter sonorensis TaxID=2989681 RepID=UPI00368672D8